MKQLLKEGWQMRRTDAEKSYPVSVPVDVYQVLFENNEIPDPYLKGNEDIVRDMADGDYEFTTVFDADEKVLADPYKILTFYGIDTIADIYLNGKKLGHTDNMHRTWRFDVSKKLKAKGNELKLIIYSAMQEAKKQWEKCPTRGSEDAWPGFSNIRKAHCMYGWDWGAHLPDAGIFRDVAIESHEAVWIDSVYVSQKHSGGKVTLSFDPEFILGEAQDLTFDTKALGQFFDRSYVNYRITVTAPDGEKIVKEDSPKTITIDDPKLWWPNGLGEQPLYTVSVELLQDGEVIDSWERKIGLRTVTVSTKADKQGNEFAPVVNGKKIFAMGADYIPEDHLLSRINTEKRRTLLGDCKLANFNFLRVWGGGYYPDDEFYDLCDEFGLLVWEDMMFACSMYELTDEFEETIRAEFADNIKRLRHHASLALWCGNNEMESFVAYPDNAPWVSKRSEVKDYLLMYERIIPEIVKDLDPDRFYWPSSPSSGGSFDDPSDPNRGDSHFWTVWHGNAPFDAYRAHNFRFLSEFGFQSFPSFNTITDGISKDKEDHNAFSYVMEKHQRNASANGKIMFYLQQRYRYPDNFKDLIYASQLLAADGIRYGVEHFRRIRPVCMGAVYWQLNDCWPVISWASIDYYGRWKALHYYAKRFFSPVMISCEEQTFDTARLDINRQYDAYEKSIRLNVTNETLEDKEILVKWYVRNNDASIVETHEANVSVPSLQSVWLDKVLLPDIDEFTQYVSFEAVENGKVVSEGRVTFRYPKYFKYLNPHLKVRKEGDELVVTADAYAESVEIRNADDNLVLSDNFFDIHGGEKRVKILRGKATGLTVRSTYDIGR